MLIIFINLIKKNKFLNAIFVDLPTQFDFFYQIYKNNQQKVTVRQKAKVVLIPNFYETVLRSTNWSIYFFIFNPCIFHCYDQHKSYKTSWNLTEKASMYILVIK